jgi:hypothetical protein
VEPISLAVAAIVAAVASKAQDRAVDTTVEGGENVLRHVVGRLRYRFSGAGDADATRALELVEEVPDSPKFVEMLAVAVDRHASADAAFASELEKLVAEARSSGVDAASITQVALGDQAVQIAGVTDSQITITHASSPARKPAA